MKSRPVGIFYEHLAPLQPLFAELKKRRIPFVRIHAEEHTYNPAEQDAPYSLVVNRISSTANLRGNAQGIFHSNRYLEHVRRLGIPVINGVEAQDIEVSKAKQLEVLASLGLPFPKTRIVNHIGQILPAARSLRFPVIVKVNLASRPGSIRKFTRVEALESAIRSGQIQIGLDHSAIVQEFVPALDNAVVRVETLNGKFLYAVKISGQSVTFSHENLAVPFDKEKVRVDPCSPPIQVIRDVERIVSTAKLDVGAVEYAVDARTGVVYYCNIAAFSDFLDDERILSGLDPMSAFVDMIEQRLWPVYEFEPVLEI